MSGHTPTGFLERQPVEVTTSAGDAVLVRGYDSRLYPDDERVTIMNFVTNAGAQLPTEICEANAAYAAACWNGFLGSDLRADQIEEGAVARLLKSNAELAAICRRIANIGESKFGTVYELDRLIPDAQRALANATPNTGPDSATGDGE